MPPRVVPILPQVRCGSEVAAIEVVLRPMPEILALGRTASAGSHVERPWRPDAAVTLAVAKRSGAAALR